MNIVNIRGEQPILARCVERLKDYLRCARAEVEPQPIGGTGDRFEITCDTRPKVHFLGVLREHGRLIGEQVRHVAIDAEELRRTHKKPLLFLAPWIADDWAEQLRRAGVFYVDIVGNAYLELDAPRVLVDVRGKRPEAAPRAEPGRLVEPSGLKVIHLLLTRKGVINAPYRKIATEAGVALGTVAVVLRELAMAGYRIGTAPREWALQKTADLVEHFVRGYALKLRPACLLGRYRHAEKDPRRRCEALTRPLQTHQIPFAMTGAWAAQEWTGHLRAETLTLYAGDQAPGAWKGQPMLPDPLEGNVIVLRHFAPTVLDPDLEEARTRPLATKLLVYAELLHDGRPREVETARMIYDRFLRAK